MRVRCIHHVRQLSGSIRWFHFGPRRRPSLRDAETKCVREPRGTMRSALAPTLISVIIAAFSLPNAQAEMFSVPLPDLIGAYEAPGHSMEASFNFNGGFAEIRSVVLTASGRGAEGVCIGWNCYPGTTLNVELTDPGGTQTWIGRLRGHSLNTGLGGTRFIPEGPLIVEIKPIDSIELGPFGYNNAYEFLAQGQGTVKIELATGSYPGQIDSAQLIIEGRMVPEPGSLTLSLTGLFVFVGTLLRRVRSSKKHHT